MKQVDTGSAGNGMASNGDQPVRTLEHMHTHIHSHALEQLLLRAADASSFEDRQHATMENLVEELLLRLGEDPERDGLVRTPARVAKALEFLTDGYRTELDAVINEAIFAEEGQGMVLVKDIEFYSLCEHHMLPFYGKVHIAYIPDGKIIGLSKLARITDLYARRLQVQERLTNQIATALESVLQPKGVAVMAEAAHFCMMMRGVQKQGSSTVTSAMRGVFAHDEVLRREFLLSVRGH